LDQKIPLNLNSYGDRAGVVGERQQRFSRSQSLDDPRFKKYLCLKINEAGFILIGALHYCGIEINYPFLIDQKWVLIIFFNYARLAKQALNKTAKIPARNAECNDLLPFLSILYSSVCHLN